MGLLDRFMGSKEEREAKRVRDLQKRAEQQYGDPAGRTTAIEQLREIGSPIAIGALLHRFTVTVNPGIKDAEEKERILEIVTGFGERSIEPVRAFLRSSDSISWGLRCLEALVPEGEAVAIVADLTGRLAGEYARTPEKKVVLVRWLAAHRDPRIPPAVLPLLSDAFDDVKIAAMETLVAQGAHDAVGPLVDRMLHDEAPRVRQAAAGALADLGAPLGDRKAETEGKLPAGFKLFGDRVARAAGAK